MSQSWLVPRSSWRERWREAVSVYTSLDSGREWALPIIAVTLAFGGAAALVAGDDLPGALLFGAVGWFGCWATLKAFDARADQRRDLIGAWHDPAFVAQAHRYRLHPDDARSLPDAALPVRMVSRPFTSRRQIGVAVLLAGTLEGRSVLLVRFLTLTGPVEAKDVVLTSTSRPGPGPGAEPESADLGEELVEWLEAEAGAFDHEVGFGWVACRRRWPHETLDSDQVGVWLAALLGFAERWDAGPRRVGAG